MSHLQPLSISYVDLCKYVESIYTSRPGDPDYDAHNLVYDAWCNWVETQACRERVLGKKLTLYPGVVDELFSGFSDDLEISYLLDLHSLPVGQLNSCPDKLRELINTAIQQGTRYLIVIVP